jgi:hypothetical protein
MMERRSEMRKSFVLLAVLLLVLGFSGIGNAYTITYDSFLAGDGTLTTNVLGATVETFDLPGSPIWSWSGSGQKLWASSHWSALWALPWAVSHRS